MAPFAIGVISRLVGSASVSRPNGGVVRLKVGDHVSRDDVIETTADGQVCVCFIGQHHRQLVEQRTHGANAISMRRKFAQGFA